MTQKDLDNESIQTLCKMNRSIFYAIREEAELRLKNYFHYSKTREIKLNKPVYCSFWNRGFNIKVDRVFSKTVLYMLVVKQLSMEATLQNFSITYSVIIV